MAQLHPVRVGNQEYPEIRERRTTELSLARDFGTRAGRGFVIA